MVKAKFNSTDFARGVADEASLILMNRYFEENPSLTDDGTALISRPGMRQLTTVGEGPIRGMESEPGSFNGELFVASGPDLYRVDKNLNKYFIYGDLNDPLKGTVNMAITAVLGDIPEFCFIADGRNLFVYVPEGFSRNTLSGSPANGDVISLGGVYYKWVNGDVNAGTQDGTSANPYFVLLGPNDYFSFYYMFLAINDAGNPGTDYYTSIIKNGFVISNSHGANTLDVQAKTPGFPGNGVAVSETGVNLAWSTPGFLDHGGEPAVTQILMPGDIGAIDVAVVNSYVIVIPNQREGFQGRFYWIEPGETTIDPLNFATAERSPDGIYGVKVFGDQFWLPGESTTEVWYATGNPEAPMSRLQGVVLDRGSWENTAVVIHETMVLVDGDGGVFTVQGSSPKRVSTPSIEEQIRRGITRQQALTL